jgi:hypothetical protein
LGSVPQRLSADTAHAFYHPHWPRMVDIFLDGASIDCAVTVDAIEGWVDIVEMRQPGESVALVMRRVHGRVLVLPALARLDRSVLGNA